MPPDDPSETRVHRKGRHSNPKSEDLMNIPKEPTGTTPDDVEAHVGRWGVTNDDSTADVEAHGRPR